MGKITAGEFMALDGVIESPDKWHFPYWSDAMGEVVGAQMAGADAMLLGRVSWQGFAEYFPNADPAEAGEEFVSYMNDTPKYVVSTTLESADAWQNSTILRSLDEVRELKQSEINLTMTGSVRLVQSLIREGLLDELHLLVHPVLVGQGQQRMFADDGDNQGLTLLDSKTIDNGVLYLIYGPAADE